MNPDGRSRSGQWKRCIFPLNSLLKEDLVPDTYFCCHQTNSPHNLRCCHILIGFPHGETHVSCLYYMPFLLDLRKHSLGLYQRKTPVVSLTVRVEIIGSHSWDCFRNIISAWFCSTAGWLNACSFMEVLLWWMIGYLMKAFLLKTRSKFHYNF